MATERFVVCGDVSDARPTVRDANPVRLTNTGAGANVRLDIERLTSPLWNEVRPELLDLLDVATYVYAADQAVSRGKPEDTDFGARWRRRLFFRVAVREPERWRAPAVLRALVDTLSFLSDDEYHFQFVAPRRERPDPPRLVFDGDPFDGEVRDVVPFSGGLDSLSGPIRRSVGDGRRVLLMHHESSRKFAPRYARLLAGLRDRCPLRPVHVPVVVNKHAGLTRDTTQRTRSFLYTALSAVLAANLSLDRVTFYENGVISLNLPPSPQVVGARATRTTHPRVLTGFGSLLTQLLGRPFTVDNALLWETKEQVVRAIAEAGCADLVRHTTSCANPRHATAEQPHCGLCSQCIDRRFAVLAAGREDDDPADEYRVDLVVGARPAGLPRAMLAAYAETASTVARMGLTDFFDRFGEAGRALRHVGGDAEAAAARVYDLYLRHARGVTRVMDESTAVFAAQLRERTLPEGCLLRMIVADGTIGPEPPAPSPEPDAAAARYVFRHSGQCWVVRYPGAREFVLRPSRGATYLHALLGQPGRPVSAVTLAYNATRNRAMLGLGSAGAQVDREALASYHARLAEIRDDLEAARADNDLAEVTRLEKESEEIRAVVRTVLDRRGRSRQASDDREGVRKAVGNAIRRTVLVIRDHNPALADHLSPPRLRCGGTPIYAPDDDIAWET